MLARKSIRKNRARNKRAKGKNLFLHRIRIGLACSLAVACLLLFSSTLILGYDFATQHSFFQIEAVTVNGVKRLSEQNVIDQARIARGANILSVNLSTARKRLLAHPAIAEAHVKRVFPSRIHLAVREHEPLAVLDLGF